MGQTTILIGIQLVLAHVLTDFVLQTNRMVVAKREKKIRSMQLYLHAFLAGLLTYLLLQQWGRFFVPLLVMVSHFAIDLWKLYRPDNLKFFLLDQLFHLLVLVFAWLYLIEGFADLFPMLSGVVNSKEVLLVGLGYLVVIFPVSFVIGKATQVWQGEIARDDELHSLQKAGRYIGIFERVLVLTFVLTNNIAAIGFLIAAKSILRFNVKSKGGGRKQTEYVLIGTLMSFSLTIVVGFLVLRLL